jgi:hypothetical protein
MEFGLSLTETQKQSLANAVQTRSGLTLRLTPEQLDGSDELALTKAQIAHIIKNKNIGQGVDLKLSKTQLQKIKKTGGFLPLIIAALAAAGALAGGAASVAKAVHEKRAADTSLEEQARHNREVEAQLQGSGICTTCHGTGLFLSKNH